jgi:cardiolipin synthase
VSHHDGEAIWPIKLLALTTLSGCATLNDLPPRELDPQTSIEEIQHTEQMPFARRAWGTAQATQNLIQTLTWDLVFRPYSTLSAVGSIALKTGSAATWRATTPLPEPADTAAPAVGHNAPMDLDVWEHELDRTVGANASTGKMRFLIDGETFFTRLSSAITSAQQRVHMRTYIFDNDDVSVAIADLLKQRSEDIEVRVLLDGVGTLLGTQVDPDNLPNEFEPPLSMTHYLEEGSHVRVRTHSNPFMTGDHVKSTIVDGELAFVGGMNIGREYRYEWHDMMMEVSGPVVAEIERDDDKAWGKAGFLGDFGQLWQTLKPRRVSKTDGNHSIRVLYTLPHDSQIYRAQLAAIRRARNYIFIENAYFSDDVVLHELVQARQRGVDVRVIVPKNGNHPIMNLSNGVAVNTMLEHGIRVYRYPGMSHIKAAVYDGWACVGSANMDAMSLRINREMNLATSDRDTVDALLESLFAVDFAASIEIIQPIDAGWRHYLAELVADVAL